MQDGPPPGGFPAIRYARRVPSTGPTGFTLFAVGGVVMAYGLYQVGQTNHERRAVTAELMEARKTLVPFLQAEEDRRCVFGGGGRGYCRMLAWCGGGVHQALRLLPHLASCFVQMGQGK